MAVKLLNYSISDAYIASVHRATCKDIERDALEHAAETYEYDSVEDALADYLDPEMVEMGYDRRDVKLHACCR